MNVQEKLNAERLKFLKSKEQKGGSAKEFRQHVLKTAAEKPSEWKFSQDELLCEAADKAWRAHEAPWVKKDTLPLFTIVGYDYESSVTIRDPGKKGRYRQVHSECATIDQAFEQNDIHMVKAAEATAAVLQERRACEAALERAGGNRRTLLYAVRDRPRPSSPRTSPDSPIPL